MMLEVRLNMRYIKFLSVIIMEILTLIPILEWAKGYQNDVGGILTSWNEYFIAIIMCTATSFLKDESIFVKITSAGMVIGNIILVCFIYLGVGPTTDADVVVAQYNLNATLSDFKMWFICIVVGMMYYYVFYLQNRSSV